MSRTFPLTGEPLPLDLVNTRPAAADLLVTADDLRAWLLVQAERFPQARQLADGRLAPADVAAVRDVRDATARVLRAVRRGARPATRDLKVLNEAQRTAPAAVELAWTGESLTAHRRRTGSPAARLTAWLAEAAAEFLADPAAANVRQCEAPDCVLLFLPAHPRRRWCSTIRCGNRVRVARHYRRTRDSAR